MNANRSAVSLIAIWLAATVTAAAQSSDESLLARFRQKVRQDLTSIPNYTCLETIERTRRAPPSPDFRPLDTVRLEVSTVAGKEVFALPGRQFEDRDVTSLVTGGTIAAGMFATFAHNLFVDGKGILKYKGKQSVDGHGYVRYDFRLTRQESGFKVQVGTYSEMVSAKGTFWFDPVTLDLFRLEVHADDIPFTLHLDDAVIRTSYARRRIGASDALLPKRSELTMTYLSNIANRDAIEFSACREYRSESTISFNARPPAAPAEVPPPVSGEPPPIAESKVVELPAELPIAPPASAPVIAAPTPNIVIRSSVREVLLDVIVRDAHGRLVTNIQPADVSVYEDGVRQQVRSFRVVAGGEVRIEDQKQAAETTPSAPRPAVNPLRTVNVVCLILNDLNPETRALAFDSARKFVDQELRPNTFIGVFTLDSSGLRPVYPFSNSRERLLKAVELAAVNQLPSINLAQAAMFNGLSLAANGDFAPNGGAVGVADASSPKDPLGIRGDMGLAVNAGLREIDALIGLIRHLAPLPFQKTVLLLGTGLTRPTDQLEYWDSLIHSATKSGVVFYAMDVYGLGVCQGDTDPDCVAHSAMGPSSTLLPYIAGLSKQQGPASVSQTTNTASTAPAAAAQGPPSASPTAQMMELAHQDDYLKFMVSSSNRQEALRDLAERTGGFLIANTNNTDKLLARVMEEVDTHYEIAYPSASGRDDGHFRKIEVKLARPAFVAETRGGYYAVPDTGEGPVTPMEMAGLRALNADPRPHAFDFLLRAYRFRDAHAIAFEMPLSNLTAAPAEDSNRRRLHASLLALVKNAQGQIVDRVSKDISSDIAADQLAAIQSELMTYEHTVNLAPGRYTIEASVVDHEGNRASTAAIEIDIPPQSALLSDITLVRRLTNLDRPPDAADPFEFTGKRVLPFVATALSTGTQPLLYFVVYAQPGNPAKPVVRVRLLRNGRVIDTRIPALPPADATGAIPVLIDEPADPGCYEALATVVEAGVTAERSLAYTVGACGNIRE